MTAELDAPTGPVRLSAHGRHRESMRERAERTIGRPLMRAVIAAQVFVSWGTHELGAWAYGSTATGWDVVTDGAWWRAWVAVALIDVAVFITAHAATSRMLPRGEDDAKLGLHKLAWRIACVGFGMSLVAQVLSLHLRTPPGWLTAAQGWIASLYAAAPVVLILVCLVFRGRVETWLDSLAVETETEIDAITERDAEQARRDTLARERAAGRALGKALAAQAGETSSGASHSPGETERSVSAAPSRPTAAAASSSRAGESTAARVDRHVLAEWAAGRSPSGGDVDRATGASTYGRKRLAVLGVGLRELQALRALGSEPTGDELDARITETDPKLAQVKGTGSRLLDAYPAGETTPPPPTPGTETRTESDAETTGETATVTAPRSSETGPQVRGETLAETAA